MTLLVFFRPPLNPNVERVAIHRSASATGPFEQIAVIEAKDGYENFVTHYEDTSVADTATYYYNALFLAPTTSAKTSWKAVEPTKTVAGERPHLILPSEVLQLIQGIPMGRVEALQVHGTILSKLYEMEQATHLLLRPTAIENEEHGSNAYDKILGRQIGRPIRLRNAPVSSVESIGYRVRGSSGSTPTAFTDLDIQIKGGNPARGTNPGSISVWPRANSLTSLYTSISLPAHTWRNTILVFISYTAGFTSATCPPDLKWAIMEGAAGAIMEVAGEAETAGLSSRSVDGYSETYTASATTTIFSARRILYDNNFKAAMKRWKRLLMA